jgi:Endonuclease/Exonuclease/phosphatase family
MKIASFNINNINSRLTNLTNWLREAEPDIVCLQKLKAADTEFPAEAIRQAGYHAVCRGEARWNGVAILARWAPVVTRMDLPGDTADGQRRYLEAAINGVLVASIYAPNGNPQPVPTGLDSQGRSVAAAQGPHATNVKRPACATGLVIAVGVPLHRAPAEPPEPRAGFWLELEAPSTAATTVAILAAPTRADRRWRRPAIGRSRRLSA